MLKCYYFWNGSVWVLIAGFCPVGQSCKAPTGNGSPGEQRSTECGADA
jgi:hypothetical protein